jgi:Zn-dependent protease
MVPDPSAPVRICEGCTSQLPASFLSCPSCGRLVHGARLGALAASAEQAEAAGDQASALQGWRSALELLPPGSRQHQVIAEKLARLTPAAAAHRLPAPGRARRSGALAGLGGLGLLLWKFKFAALFLLGKGKLLLLGLLQLKTLLSMVFALGVYASVSGWKFAVGLVVSIYVHEMGHVAALRRHGIAATAPMFVPGLGAFVRLNQRPASAAEDAEVGLAGPVWGTAAALAFLVVGLGFGWPSFLATAHVGAWINIFNLLPIGSLDGGRAFRALDRRQRAFVAAAVWLLALVSRDGLLVVLAMVATARAFGAAPDRGERRAFFTFLVVAAVLTALVVATPSLPR